MKEKLNAAAKKLGLIIKTDERHNQVIINFWKNTRLAWPPTVLPSNYLLPHLSWLINNFNVQQYIGDWEKYPFRPLNSDIVKTDALVDDAICIQETLEKLYEELSK